MIGREKKVRLHLIRYMGTSSPTTRDSLNRNMSRKLPLQNGNRQGFDCLFCAFEWNFEPCTSWIRSGNFQHQISLNAEFEESKDHFNVFTTDAIIIFAHSSKNVTVQVYIFNLNNDKSMCVDKNASLCIFRMAYKKK